MQQIRGNCIEDVLDLLDPSFPERGDIGSWDEAGIPFHPTRERAAAIQTAFRQHIEEWIESGFDDEGREWPGRRNFKERKRTETFFYPSKNGQESFEVPLLKNGKPVEPIPNAVKEMQSLFRGHQLIDPTGTVYLVSGVGHRSGAEVVGIEMTGMDVTISADGGPTGGVRFRPKLWERQDPRVIATWLFMEFYGSEWTYKLVHCKSCDKFAAPRTVGESYKRGWRCPKTCGRTITAVESMKKSRKAKHDRWFNSAVKACAQWDAMLIKPRLDKASWITALVNKSLTALDKIKRTSIIRKDKRNEKDNLTLIEEAARERNHA